MRFSRTVTHGVRKFGTILTVDRVGNQFWWHVAVSVLDSALKPVPIIRITSSDKDAAECLAHELLSDVGRWDSDECHYDDKSLHIIRNLTIAEERQAKRSL